MSGGLSGRTNQRAMGRLHAICWPSNVCPCCGPQRLGRSPISSGTLRSDSPGPVAGRVRTVMVRVPRLRYLAAVLGSSFSKSI